MKLIILFGPPAVGKMTVGQELSKITGYKLLHNHMTIDLVTEFFDFGTPQFERLVPTFRQMLSSIAHVSRHLDPALKGRATRRKPLRG